MVLLLFLFALGKIRSTYRFHILPSNAADASVKFQMFAPGEQRVQGIKLRTVSHELPHLHHVRLNSEISQAKLSPIPSQKHCTCMQVRSMKTEKNKVCPGQAAHGRTSKVEGRP